MTLDAAKRYEKLIFNINCLAYNILCYRISGIKYNALSEKVSVQEFDTTQKAFIL